MALVIVTVILGAVAAIDLGVIVRRKRRGEESPAGSTSTVAAGARSVPHCQPVLARYA